MLLHTLEELGKSEVSVVKMVTEVPSARMVENLYSWKRNEMVEKLYSWKRSRSTLRASEVQYYCPHKSSFSKYTLAMDFRPSHSRCRAKYIHVIDEETPETYFPISAWSQLLLGIVMTYSHDVKTTIIYFDSRRNWKMQFVHARSYGQVPIYESTGS